MFVYARSNKNRGARRNKLLGSCVYYRLQIKNNNTAHCVTSTTTIRCFAGCVAGFLRKCVNVQQPERWATKCISLVGDVKSRIVVEFGWWLGVLLSCQSQQTMFLRCVYIYTYMVDIVLATEYIPQRIVYMLRCCGAMDGYGAKTFSDRLTEHHAVTDCQP